MSRPEPPAADGPTTGSRLPLAVLAVAVYLPLLATAPGRVGADTKSYLYLDPARLLSRAWSMWDPSIGLGTVSHQTIGYLWPMGPWFWAFERLGVPDWVAQRLWLGTILLAAGAGTRWLLRRVLGWRDAPATVAAFAYACTPYVLTLAARISAILLPYAGLPWLIGLAALSLRHRSWRHPALFALVVATVGSVNATALVLAGVGPLLWLGLAWLGRRCTLGALAATVARIGVLTLAANLWWLAGLWAQGGYGIEILRYTETAEVVASASVAVEVLRGLGYWFFYGGDRLGPWIEPSVTYTQRIPLLLLTYALPTVSLLGVGRGLGGDRRDDGPSDRAFFTALVGVGTVLAVGAHPWDGAAPGRAAIESFLLSDLGLAMRSLPRAAPLVALGLAAGLGAGAASLADAASPRLRRAAGPAALAAGVAAYAALPPLWTGQMVADNLDRPSEVPAYWDEVAAHLDAGDRSTRVLEVPGIDFASYRWGNTVDPITPGLTDRAYVARELIPYGSAASADLVNALDRRLQERVVDRNTLSTVARLLGAGDVVVRDDLQYERFRTPRPYDLADVVAGDDGLGPAVGFGTPSVNTASPAAPLLDDLYLVAGDEESRPPVEVLPVEEPLGIVRAHGDGGVVLAGDGEGLVDAAGAGLLDGDELVRYGATLGSDGAADALASGAVLVVTDGNRRQGRRWSTVRDTLGFVEGPNGAGATLGTDLTDNRLPLFPDAEDGWETTSEPGAGPEGARAAATSYGNPISFTPEYAPTNAVDGDLGTAWRTGAFSDVRGEALELAHVQGDHVRLVQLAPGSNRWITSVRLLADGEAGPGQVVALDDSSRSDAGQLITLDRPVTSSLRVEVVDDSTGLRPAFGRPVRFGGFGQVGFREVTVEAGPVAGGDRDPATPPGPEALVLPPAATALIDDDVPVALVLTRWRTDPSEYVRQDPQIELRRRWDQPVARTFSLDATVRVATDAGDALLDDLLGWQGPAVAASSRLAGTVAARGSAALDGDPSTWWSPGFSDPLPLLTVDTGNAGGPVTIDSLEPVFVDDGVRSLPTQLRVVVDGDDAGGVVVDLPPGGGRIDLPSPLTGRSFRFEVAAVAERRTTEWFSNASVVVPPAIAELGVPALTGRQPGTFDTGCRTDLLAVDGEGVGLRVRGGTADGAELTATVCAGGPASADGGAGESGEGGEGGEGGAPGSLRLGAGAHELRSTPGPATGLDVDRVVLRSGVPASGPVLRGARAGERDAPEVRVLADGRAEVRVAVSGAQPGEPFWLVLGQSFNAGWRASGSGVVATEPSLVDGFANGWLVEPTADSFEVTLTWAPQRVVTTSLLLSAVAVLACAGVALVGTRRARRAGHLATVAAERAGAAGEVVAVVPPAAAAERGPGAARWLGASAAVAVGGFLFAGPLVGLAVLAAGAACLRRPVLHRALPWAAAATYAVAASYVLLRQAIARPGSAFEWPAELETAHQPALLAVALLALAAALPRPPRG